MTPESPELPDYPKVASPQPAQTQTSNPSEPAAKTALTRQSRLAQVKKKRSWQRRLKYFYYRFIRLQGSPKALARGLAAGIFAGLFPLFGFQTILGVAIAAVIRGNKIMAAAGTWVSNPFTYVPIYALNFQVGRWLLGDRGAAVAIPKDQSLQVWMAMGSEITLALFVGCSVMGAICAVVGYFGGLRLIQWGHQRRSTRR
ncbi:MAG: DUF2062 domain-containing protein [Leptolyngbyaceae cyanobacterium SM1_1_3]|nr:DUF2062 domain-containing protein [Leptolyngbyaceae cyanobacterium SM1_1_3]NJN04863.1 DUF2062 domain-containing protein [Leptolyngbyaceae cyanobacterium RM1_1_2]NJO10294.1 DUF2062 domain-containing protein [Leptolyngbyaceae cyanobacterium SL_1_1]